MLDELGPGVTGALARTADQLRADMELLDQLALEAYDGLRDDADPDPGLEVKALADLPPLADPGRPKRRWACACPPSPAVTPTMTPSGVEQLRNP